MAIFKMLIMVMTVLSCMCPIRQLQAQDKMYAEQIIDTLCSPIFQGRGYVNRGDSLAAEFLKSEYKRHGAKAIEDNYFQHFRFPVNTFPGELRLSIDKTKLKAGKDYLVAPSSASGKGQAKTVNLTIDDVMNDEWLEILENSKRKALLFDLNGFDALEGKQSGKVREFIQYLKFEADIQPELVLIHHHKPLPWSISAVQASKPIFLLTTADVAADHKKIAYEVNAKYYENYRSKNVIGIIEGAEKPDSTIFLTAHYDHLGAMGKEAYFPGANDNASGVALMLDLMQHYSMQKPKYTMVFVAFGAEEAGLIGSKYFVENPLMPLNKIKFLINLDLIGTGEEGITVVNGQQYTSQFAQLESINQTNNLLPQIKARGEACNSDHCFFYKRGVPSFFIYAMGGIQAYHDVYDVPETLPLSEYDDIFTLVQYFIDEL